MANFSEIQPGVRRFAMLILERAWPQWDRNTLAPEQWPEHWDGEPEPWPGRDVVAVELLRALREAGLINGVFRSDYTGWID